MMQLVKLLFDIFFTLFGWITSYYSIFSLKNLPEFWKGILITVAALMCFIYGVVHVIEYYRQNRFIFNNQEDANNYLSKWIGKNTGHVVIYTNDMSWADTDKLRGILQEKAENKNLTMCLRRTTTMTEALHQKGAELFIHDKMPELKARFIIVDYKGNNPKVSAYTTDDQRRYINKQYDTQHDPLVREVFMDLAKLATQNATTVKP